MADLFRTFMFNTSNLFVSPLPCLVLWKVLNSPGEQADTMEAMDIVGPAVAPFSCTEYNSASSYQNNYKES